MELQDIRANRHFLNLYNVRAIAAVHLTRLVKAGAQRAYVNLYVPRRSDFVTMCSLGIYLPQILASFGVSFVQPLVLVIDKPKGVADILIKVLSNMFSKAKFVS